jgi:hypothetical protein
MLDIKGRGLEVFVSNLKPQTLNYFEWD